MKRIYGYFTDENNNEIKCLLKTTTNIFFKSGSKKETETLFCVEARFRNKWIKLGDEKGLFKFTTKEEADGYLLKISEETKPK
jgi:hypothetical protein